MKQQWYTTQVLLTFVMLMLLSSPLSAGGKGNLQTFHASLTPYGHWLTIEGGITVWHPVFVEKYWRPYLFGRWIWTQWGWYWVSDEPFGWIVYHYGRWFYHDFYGWLWFPDDEWGPSWVTWRYTDEYIGWAPLPPTIAVRVSFHRSHFFHRHKPHNDWCFVSYEAFREPIRYEHMPLEHIKNIYEKSSSFENNTTNNSDHNGKAFTPEFIAQKVRTLHTSSGRTFGSRQGTPERGRETFSNAREKQNESALEDTFAQNQQTKRRRSSLEHSSNREEQKRSGNRPRVTSSERTPRELREELLQRYEQSRSVPPPTRRSEEGTTSQERGEEKARRRR